jgi:tetrahydromethanopterin S-methyltransferase subunit G
MGKAMGTRSKLKVEQHYPQEELETIEFVVAILKQHEKDFDRLVTRLHEIATQLHETHKVIRRIDKLDGKIESLRSEISNITKCRPFGR